MVTGGAGFIGSHVVHRLLAIGARPIVVDDFSMGRPEKLAGAEEAGARVVVGDIRDQSLMEELFAETDLVIHMACANLRSSLVDPSHTHSVNAGGTLAVCLASVAAGVKRLAYVSSAEVYGSALSVPMNEDHPLRPTTVYGASKAAGEHYAIACMKTYGLPITIIRPFNTYGIGDHNEGEDVDVIPMFTGRIMRGRPPVIFGDGSQTRTFIWVEETADAIVRAATTDVLIGEAVNVGSSERVSINEISRLLLQLLDATDLTPEYDAGRAGDVEHHCAGTAKAQETMGFRAMVTIPDGLARYIASVDRSGP